MNLQVFHKKELYPLGIGEYLNRPESDYFLLYAPLTQGMLVVSAHQLVELGKALKKEGTDAGGVLKELMEGEMKPKSGYARNPREAYALTILPNYICNFACSYCYAAKGHTNREIELPVVKAVLDYFIDPKRLKRRDLYISFGGGGEPFLSWPVVQYSLEYATALADKYGFEVHFSFASNGSIVDLDIIMALHEYRVKANISFDILKEIQNLQRGNYEEVCQGLDAFLDADIVPTINSVITPANVLLQEEMVEEVHRRFPKLKRLSFDSVVDGKLYTSPEELAVFYQQYIEHFFEARRIGKKYGIEVSCIKLHNLDAVKERACAGGFDLTPEGTISMCFFVSSPQEELYDDFIYGRVEKDGQLVFDEEKYKRLVGYNTKNNGRCKNCFVKWHCGGGCLYHSKSYSPEMHGVMCDFLKEFTRRALLERLNEQIRECGYRNLKDMLENG